MFCFLVSLWLLFPEAIFLLYTYTIIQLWINIQSFSLHRGRNMHAIIWLCFEKVSWIDNVNGEETKTALIGLRSNEQSAFLDNISFSYVYKYMTCVCACTHSYTHFSIAALVNGTRLCHKNSRNCIAFINMPSTGKIQAGQYLRNKWGSIVDSA